MTNQVSLLAILLLLVGMIMPTCAQEVSMAQAPSEASISEHFACPMHSDVSSSKPGKCSKCGMELKATSAAITEEFIVRIESLPKHIQPGQKTRLRFVIFNPRTKEQVKDFNIQHEKPFHLFIVRADLNHFDHIHPVQQPDGSFTIETILPQAGLYHVFCDISPVGGVAQTIHQNLVTAGFKGDAASLQARLQPDQQWTKPVEGLRVTLDFAPETPTAGQPTLLRYKLSDASSGQPIQDLQPYLGAWGHTVILSADAMDYLHSHPLEDHAPEAELLPAKAPATIYFETFFPRAGMYRIWSQFQRQNKIITVYFDIKVTGKEGWLGEM